MIEIVYAITIPALLAIFSLSDLKNKRVPNTATIPFAVGGFALAQLVFWDTPHYSTTMVFGISVLAFILLFLRLSKRFRQTGFIGGADIKILIGTVFLNPFMLYWLILFLPFFYLIYRFFNKEELGTPMIPAIFMAWVFSIPDILRLLA